MIYTSIRLSDIAIILQSFSAGPYTGFLLVVFILKESSTSQLNTTLFPFQPINTDLPVFWPQFISWAWSSASNCESKYLLKTILITHFITELCFVLKRPYCRTKKACFKSWLSESKNQTSDYLHSHDNYTNLQNLQFFVTHLFQKT